MSVQPPTASSARETASRAGDALAQVPPEYEVVASREGLYVVERARRVALERAGFDASHDGALAKSELSGRKPLFELALPGTTLLVRRFSHGGLLRVLTGRRFLDRDRPLRELLLSSRLRAAGVRTPRVVAARARRAPIRGWTLDLVLERVPDTLDLEAVLVAARAGRVPREVVRLLSVALGLFVRRLHELRFVHADLTPKNVLVERASLAQRDPRLWIVDLDRSRFVDALDECVRRDNLRRLWRFIERREERDGRALGRSDVARFFLGYDFGGGAWKDDWRAIAARHRRAGVFHRVGWGLEALFGGSGRRGASHIS